MQNRKTVILGLDTSGAPLLVAAQKADKIAYRRRSGIKQERLLFPALHSALAAVAGKLQEVKTIFIVRGPGRFTGIRISLTFASMLHYLNQTEVRAATVFEILRYQAEKSAAFKKWEKNHPSGVLGVVLHAFRHEYFLQFFEDESSAPMWLSLEELQTKLSSYKKPLFLVGTGADRASLASFLPATYTFANPADCVVRPGTLLELAEQDRWTSQSLEPLYLKPARFELVQPK